MKYYIVYQITNLVNGKIYIGVHQTNNLNDEYMGSGYKILNAINKYGLKNFKRDILFVYDNSKEMYAKEKELVNEDFLLRKDVYNLKLGGEGGWEHINNSSIQKFHGKRHSENTKKRISEISSRYRHTENTRLKIKNKHWSKTNPDKFKDHIKALKKILKGKRKPLNEELKMKISLALKGKEKPILICPQCGKNGKGPIMYRFHFDNCKMLE